MALAQQSAVLVDATVQAGWFPQFLEKAWRPHHRGDELHLSAERDTVEELREAVSDLVIWYYALGTDPARLKHIYMAIGRPEHTQPSEYHAIWNAYPGNRKQSI